MAGFFGLFDYTKPGKGVRKDEPQKSRFAHFWELFFRKFWKLIQLNLLYLLFCLPVITIGPATAGITYVLRNMATEQPVFLFSDFWDAFRLNWKQSFAYSVLMFLCSIFLFIALQFYGMNSGTYGWMFLPTALTLFVGLILLMMSFYVMLMIVTLDLSLMAILKNAAILSIICLKTNLLTVLFTGLIVAALVLFFPLSFLLFLVIIPAWIGFIVCYNSYPGIKRYAIDPFLEQQNKPPVNPDDALFADEKPEENK